LRAWSTKGTRLLLRLQRQQPVEGMTLPLAVGVNEGLARAVEKDRTTALDFGNRVGVGLLHPAKQRVGHVLVLLLAATHFDESCQLADDGSQQDALAPICSGHLLGPFEDLSKRLGRGAEARVTVS
jgi:hypothetical protein